MINNGKNIINSKIIETILCKLGLTSCLLVRCFQVGFLNRCLESRVLWIILVMKMLLVIYEACLHHILFLFCVCVFVCARLGCTYKIANESIQWTQKEYLRFKFLWIKRTTLRHCAAGMSWSRMHMTNSIFFMSKLKSTLATLLTLGLHVGDNDRLSLDIVL